MNLFRDLHRNVILALLLSLFALTLTRPATAQILFTEEEKDYLKNAPTLKVASIKGIAPLFYLNNKGETVGIFNEVLNLIADSTGLDFELQLHNSTEEAYASDPYLFMGTDPVYARTAVLSKPFLQSETVLFANSRIDITDLNRKRLAVVSGATSPTDIDEEYVMRFGTREDTLDAVEKGLADYGHGNAYSVAFYTLQNNYKNIITVPITTQDRHYSIELVKPDYVLLSILNKAIDAIEDHEIHRIVLRVASKIEQKVTLSMVVNTYGLQIAGSLAIVIITLSVSVYLSLRVAKQLALQNSRYELLSQISNEYLYEYDCATNELNFSDQLQRFLMENGYTPKIEEKLRTKLLPEEASASQKRIKLSLPSGQDYIFQPISSTIRDHHGKPHSVIGKLVDITAEVFEKEKLLSQSQLDGLTGLYNANTIKDLIVTKLINKVEGQMDALIVLDLDRLKQINDTFGHLAGDKVLKELSLALKTIFRQTDLLGRIGGDEFTVYIENIPSVDLIRLKGKEINTHLEDAFPGIQVSTSIGAALIKGKSDYDTVFEIADQALYRAKGQGLGNIVISDN